MTNAAWARALSGIGTLFSDIRLTGTRWPSGAMLALLAVLVMAGCTQAGGPGGPGPNTSATPGPAPTRPQQTTAPGFQPAGPVGPQRTNTPPAAVQPGGTAVLTPQPAPGTQAPGTQPQAAAQIPTIRVGLILPLSGPAADVGQALLEAAQLGLFELDPGYIELVLEDTQGTAPGAVQAAQSVMDRGAQIIIGPLFSASVRAVQPVAAQRGVNLLAFSTDWGAAGGNVYIMGFLPFRQIARIVEHARGQGLTRFGVLAPESAYGEAVITAFQQEMARTGGQITRLVRYQPGTPDLTPIVREFTEFDARVAALEARREALAERTDPEARTERAQLEAAKTSGALPYDAVLLPDGGQTLRNVAKLFPFFDAGPDKVQLLGTGLWDDPELATEPALVGGWYAAPPLTTRARFERSFQDAYGRTPPRIASLAYDASTLVVQLAARGLQTTGRPAFDQPSLTVPQGFIGADGLFRFQPNGLIERGLAVLEMGPDGPFLIGTAPDRFATSGVGN